MTGLNTVLGTLTGPGRLRSALRQKTVAINSLLVALDGPAELRVRIPASVFGGDIFGVMSSQLREALIVPPGPAPVISQPRRKHSLPSTPDPLAKYSENFSPLVDWLKQSTFPGGPIVPISERTLPLNQNTTVHNKGVSFPGPQASRLQGTATGFLRYRAGETPAVPGKSMTELRVSSSAKQLGLAPAFISSLKRYWESARERHDTGSAPTQGPLTATSASTVDFSVSEPEQRAAPPAWPNFVGRDVAEKLRSLTNATNPLQKPARLSSQLDRQIQNVFNIEVNHANQYAPAYDNLGDRIAEILHDQALQHGIDIT